MKQIYSIKKIIWGLVLWQLISIGLIAVGVWPMSVALCNTVLLGVAFVALPRFKALQLFLVSLPFFVVLPSLPIADFPMWRILVVWLFMVVVVKAIYENRAQLSIRTLARSVALWDKWLFALGVLAIISLVFARFPVHGAKQIIYVLNAYLLYIIVRLSVTTAEETVQLVRYTLYSLLITVLLGYVQYAATLFAAPYYFWQYWATWVSSAYYGEPLGSVLSYSNSWFSANGAGQSLRMFGIVQDTHAFAVIAFFGLALWSARAKIAAPIANGVQLLRQQSVRFWIGVVVFCFAIVTAGTRGVWAAMAVPVLTAIIFLSIRRLRLFAIFPLVGYGAVVLLFIVSPFIAIGLNAIRTINSDDNFLDRAESIYDLNESSNVGRLQIWKESVGYALRHPLGTGYGNFITSVVTDIPADSSFESVGQQENLRYNLPQKFITAHSLFLHVLVELGVLGLALVVALALAIMYAVFTQLRNAQFVFTPATLLATSIGFALIWLFAYGLFDVTILNDRVLLYTMALLGILALHERSGILKQSK